MAALRPVKIGRLQDAKRWVDEAQRRGVYVPPWAHMAATGRTMERYHLSGCSICREFRQSVRAARLADASAPAVEHLLQAKQRSLLDAIQAAPATKPFVFQANVIGPDEIARRFTYHKPSGMAQGMHSSLRMEAKDFASRVLSQLPAGREASLAFTAFEEATFWAHAAIARDQSLHEET